MNCSECEKCIGLCKNCKYEIKKKNMREWYNNNKTNVSEQKRIYYKNNQEKIKNYNREKYYTRKNINNNNEPKILDFLK